MAGDWIKFDVTTPDKPEVVRMAAALGIDQDAVVGKLLRVWAWADQNTITCNGESNAVTVTSSFLDRLTFCAGFAEAMKSVGWLVGGEGEFTFPNFDRHNGKTAKDRALTNRRVAKNRVGNAKSNAASVTSVTEPSLEKPLPEKRREDKEQEISATGVPPAAPRRQSSVPVDDIVDAYNSTLTRLAKVRSVTPKRKRAIEALWRSSPLAGDVVRFRQYFEECEADPFLSGVGPYRNGHENWRPDFDYLTRPDVVTKTYERVMDAIDRESVQ